MLTSNYCVIHGDQLRKVEMTAPFTKEFEIEGTDSGASAVILLMLKGLTGDADPVEVSINGQITGKLYPNKNSDPESWFTQILHFSASEGSLNPNAKNSSTKNVIQIPAAGSTAKFDKFHVQNVVCFYKSV